MAVEPPVDRPQEAAADEVAFCSPSFPKLEANPQDEIRAVARNLADQPLLNPEPGVWGALTAISKNARLRRQGMNVLLIDDEHSFGRCVEDPRFQIISMAISANHCKVSRERVAHPDRKADSNISMSVFLKDTSTNGTYLNWVRLRKGSPKARLKHGDIISFVSPPHDDTSYAFVYREVPYSNAEGSKRKSEDFGPECKRLKGLGIGALDGPISLEDVRSLERSNTTLRHQLESEFLTNEALRSENRVINARYENELKEQKETVTISYDCQIKGLISSLDAKQVELNNLSATAAELRNSIKDLNERLDASIQSRTDADEIMNSQKVAISELEAQLNEERNQRRAERETAEADLKSAIQRAHLEAQEELKRQADVYLRQHREQQDFIAKLQESERESRLLVETLRSKLEDARESLVTSEKKARQLEAQFQDEHIAFANSRKTAEALESDLRKLRKELENEKVAREEAWAKVSSLELEIASSIHDLSIEKQRFQGARERIILRETQLRSFYSTTEEISALFAKQQEQLKAMQKTLEDEEKYENSLFAVDSSGPANLNFNPGPRENPKDSSSACTPNNSPFKDDGTDDSDDVCSTEKHECDIRSQGGNTQDIECDSADRLARGFGSEINGVGAAVIPDADPTDTERILGTESQVGYPVFNEKSSAFHKCNSLAGETMQIDDEVEARDDNQEPPTHNSDLKLSPSSKLRKEDTQNSTFRTADLLASEAAGSWAVDTAPSVNGENESPVDHCVGGEATAAACQILGSDAQGAGATRGIIKLTKEHRSLAAMINVVAPDFRHKFHSFAGAAESESSSGAETEGSNQSNAGSKNDKVCDSEGDSHEDDETNVVNVMIEDSVG